MQAYGTVYGEDWVGLGVQAVVDLHSLREQAVAKPGRWGPEASVLPAGWWEGVCDETEGGVCHNAESTVHSVCCMESSAADFFSSALRCESKV